MIASTFEFPEERQTRLHFEEEGRDCSFYAQETAWYSNECEQAWKSWKELYAGVSNEARGRHKRCVSDSSTPWHQCLALVNTTDKDFEDLRCAQDGLWVAYHLRKKRTRNQLFPWHPLLGLLEAWLATADRALTAQRRQLSDDAGV